MMIKSKTIDLKKADMARLPVQERLVGPILRMRAEEEGDRPYLTAQGRTFSFAGTEKIVRDLARGLRDRGVSKGDRVAVLLPNCPEFVFIWYACNLIGAALVPINTDYRGYMLDAVLDDSGASCFFASAPLIAALETVKPEIVAKFGLVAVVGEGAATVKRPGVVPFDHLLIDNGPDPEIAGDYRDLQSISYTSGTTGSSKGVPLCHSHAFSSACSFLKITEMVHGDVLYTPLTLFHGLASRLGTLPALMVGGQVVLGDRFSAKRFWEDAAECGATLGHTIHTIPPVLKSQPFREAEREHKMRALYIAHYDAEFEERFNTRLLQAFGLTETAVVTYTAPDKRRVGSIGHVHEEWEAQIVDDQDFEVPVGTHGEIVLRPRLPYIMMQGYLNKPNETLAAWRNLWFHTGDIGKQDEDGYFYFVDRKKERIRRRGENISSWDVEQGVSAHPDILECVALPHPAEGGEDDIRVVAVLREGCSVAPEVLMDWLQDRMPRFMMPSYLEFIPELPRTPNNKIEKYRLVSQGLGANAWSAQNSGYELKRRTSLR